MRISLLIAACLSFAMPAISGAQLRTREILKWDGNQIVRVTAASDGKLVVGAIDGADKVILHVDPPDIQKWADSAARMMDASVVAPGSDKVTFESGRLFGYDEGFVIFQRDVKGKRSALSLYFSDQYDVNRFYVPMTNARAKEFLDALRKGAAAVVEITPAK